MITGERQNHEGPMVCPTGLEVFPSGYTHCPNHKIELAAQSVDQLVGQTIDRRYEIEENISWGGWASIYRAKDLKTGDPVAVKIMHSHLSTDGEAVGRFQREAKAAAGLSHPSLAKTYDAGILPDGQPFLVMELVNGMTLADRILTLGPLTAEQAIPLFVQTCDALAAAHLSGIIHRDIKPSNLMIAQDESGELSIKLVDFGLARAMENCGLDIEQITRTGQTLGSPAYMSPEQCLGHKLDARSDIYALGCTMYEAVSGRPPFVGQSIMEYMHKHTYDEPPPMEMRSDETNFGYNFAHTIMQALSKNPADRQQTMAQLRDQLQACRWQHEPDKIPVPMDEVLRTSVRLKAPEPVKPTVSPTIRLWGWLSTLGPIILAIILICVGFYVIRDGQQQETPTPTVGKQQTAAPAAEQEKRQTRKRQK